MNGFSRRQWLVALAIAGLIHGGAAVFALRSPPASGSVAAGIGGITVAMGPAGRAPGSLKAVPPPTAAETAEPLEELEEMRAVEPPLQKISPSDIEEVQAPEPIELIEVPEAPEPIEAFETPEVTDAPEAHEVEEAGELAPPDAVLSDVVSSVLDQQPVATVMPSPRKPPQPVEKKSEPPLEKPAEEPGQLAGAGGEAGDLDDGERGNGTEASGGGLEGVTADYFAVLQAWLEQYKVYPRRAMSRRLEGIVSLRFVMNREGQVLDYQIEQSSGHRLLDRAVESLIERAQPLPTIPDEIREKSLVLVVPISFLLK